MADNLLDKASILLTPTAYDNGSMLSVKPENGDGDFTFSRNGAASRVNSSSNIVTEGTNLPRINYENGIGSWLLEPQSTNLVTYSENLNTYFQQKIDTTITDNYGISPSGQSNSSRIQFADATSFCYNIISVSTDHTASVYVKGTSGQTIRFGIGGNVTTGELFTFNGLWQVIEYTASSATQIFFSSYYGATASDFEAFGLQLEQQSFATSYIPTDGAANTRIQDIASNSGNASLINSTEGVLYAEIAALANNLSARYISINDGTNQNQIDIHYDVSSNQIKGFCRVSNSLVGIVEFIANDITDFNKIAFKYKENDFALWVNGVEVDTDTSGVVPSENTLNKLNFLKGAGQFFYGKVKALAVYKEALTDEQLTALTTI
jgi:hypothetical protein